MKLPDRISVKITRSAPGCYTYEDTQGLGIVCDARPRSKGRCIEEAWRCRVLPGQVFPDMKSVIDALHALPEPVTS